LCLFFQSVQAQISSYRTKTFFIKDSVIVLDTLPILPGSIVFINDSSLVNSEYVKIDYEKALLKFNSAMLTDSAFIGKAIEVKFQVIHFNTRQVFSKHEYIKARKDFSMPKDPSVISYNRISNNNAANIWNDQLNKSGSIIRGINFGNNQNLAVNSNLNLQVSGKINNELELLLSASDNNIPIQPEGSSLQLQEFDQVYVQLRNKKFSITAGDFQLGRPEGYFLNYYKRARGLNVTNAYKQGLKGNDSLIWTSQISGAVSRGKFSRNVIQGIEGNQGPYRLKGSENELFIIILSGTEKIFIDGRLLQRGQENDYVIDYNSGELVFTTRQQITKDKRIIAEFQYSEKNYARTLLVFNNAIKTKTTSTYFNVYSEQDNKNRPLQQDLDSAQKQIMLNVGDNIEAAIYSGAQSTAFNSGFVLYTKKDTLVGANTYSIFSYSNKNDSNLYQVRFSFVGDGKGNYIQSQSLANGKVYNWVAPVNGIAVGSYEPIVKLVTPKQKQMFVLGFQQNLQKAGLFSIEGALSKNDINLYSDFDKTNDLGTALKANYSLEKPVSNKYDTLKKIVVGFNANYEYLQSRFSSIERFRSEEFERDWNRNINTIGIVSDNHIVKTGAYISKKDKWRTAYEFNVFNEGTNFNGTRHLVNLFQNFKNLFFTYNNSYSEIKSEGKKSFYYRHLSAVTAYTGPIKWQVKDNFENNYFTAGSKNIFYVNQVNNGFRFWEKEASVGNKDTIRNSLKLFYRQRKDELYVLRKLNTTTLADNAGLVFDVRQFKNHPFRVLATYRNLKVKDSLLSSLEPDNGLLSRIEYHPTLYNGFIQSDLFYEIGSGLEQKKEFRFVEVPAGQGNFTWIDYNENGVKELNEFENAIFNDQAKYIRVFVQSNEYVKVYNGDVSVNLRLTPSSIITDSSSKNIRWIKRFDYQINWISNRKTTDVQQRFDFPAFASKSGEQVPSYQNNIYQGFFFNKSSAVFSLQYILQYNEQKQLLFNGGDERQNKSNEFIVRYSPVKSITFQNAGIMIDKKSNSKAFESRNYTIENRGIKSELIFQTGTKWRATIAYKYNNKANQIGNKEKANVQELSFDFKYNQAQKGSLLLNFTFTNNVYNSTADNSAIAFEMLNGLSKGQNYLWGVNYRVNLNSYLQININYNGRQVAGNKQTIHTGGIQAGAYF
jgi:hypothetical protein